MTQNETNLTREVLASFVYTHAKNCETSRRKTIWLWLAVSTLHRIARGKQIINAVQLSSLVTVIIVRELTNWWLNNPTWTLNANVYDGVGNKE